MAATPVYQLADTQTNTSANGTMVLNKPTNLATGDLMVVQVGAASISGSWSTIPSGWTTIANSLNMSANNPSGGIFSKVATGSEPSTYTFVHSSNQRSVGVASRISGGDPTTPIDSFNSSVNNGNSTTIAMGTISPTTNNNLIMVFAFLSNAPMATSSCTNVSSFTSQYDASAPSTGGRMTAATGASSAAGSATASGTFASSTQSIGAVISIAPQNVVQVAFFGSTFGFFTPPLPSKSMVATLFGSVFGWFTPTTSGTSQKWNNVQKHTSTWNEPPKS